MPVGERAAARACAIGEADEAQRFHRRLANAALLGAVALAAQHRVEEAGTRRSMQADRDVLERGHLAEQLEVLKGAANAGAPRAVADRG